jgi:hypothetical protein
MDVLGLKVSCGAVPGARHFWRLRDVLGSMTKEGSEHDSFRSSRRARGKRMVAADPIKRRVGRRNLSHNTYSILQHHPGHVGPWLQFSLQPQIVQSVHGQESHTVFWYEQPHTLISGHVPEQSASVPPQPSLCSQVPEITGGCAPPRATRESGGARLRRVILRSRSFLSEGFMLASSFVPWSSTQIHTASGRSDLLQEQRPATLTNPNASAGRESRVGQSRVSGRIRQQGAFSLESVSTENRCAKLIHLN